jgi:hypothetical protein
VRRLAKRAGIDKLISPHSLRLGCYQHRCGAADSVDGAETERLVETSSGVVNLDTQADLSDAVEACLREEPGQQAASDPPAAMLALDPDAELGDQVIDVAIAVVIDG